MEIQFSNTQRKWNKHWFSELNSLKKTKTKKNSSILNFIFRIEISLENHREFLLKPHKHLHRIWWWWFDLRCFFYFIRVFFLVILSPSDMEYGNEFQFTFLFSSFSLEKKLNILFLKKQKTFIIINNIIIIIKMKMVDHFLTNKKNYNCFFLSIFFSTKHFSLIQTNRFFFWIPKSTMKQNKKKHDDNWML